jgi:hypothetical protein
LANTTSRCIPLDDGFSVEMIFKPSIPDTITNWILFDDDNQIINFLTISDTFQDAVIDDEAHQQKLQYYLDEAIKVNKKCVSKNVLTLEVIQFEK